ncbi:MAG: ATP-binding protein, partial [Tepidiformaceae bacterium]
MGESRPTGTAGRVLDAEAARAALADACATHDLDASLARSAEILLDRFDASMALVYVARPGRKAWGAPSTGRFALENAIPNLEVFRDHTFGDRLRSLGASTEHDLANIASRTAGQEAVFAGGIRSTAWAALQGPGITPLGFILLGSVVPGRFDNATAEELRSLAAIMIAHVRPAVLLEERQLERRLLQEEARLLGEIARAETEVVLATCIAEGVRQALEGDLALVFVQSPVNRTPILVGSPLQEFDSGTWENARLAFGTGDNSSIIERSKATGAFTIGKLAGGTTPLERWAHQSLRGQSAAIAARSQESGGLGFGIAVIQRTPKSWSEAQTSFLVRLGRVLQISVERLRRGASAIEHALQLEDQSAKVQALMQLMTTLSLQSPPEEVAELIARQVRLYLGADAVLVYAFDHDSGTRVRVAVDAIAGGTFTPERMPLLESAAYRGARLQAHARYTANEPEASPEWLRDSAVRTGYQSAVCVRLDAAGEPVGMIAAGSLDPDRMTQQALEDLAALATPAGMVLERARAVTALQLQTQRTQAVLDILAALGPAESFDLVADPVASALRLMYSADHCAVATIESGTVTIAAVDSSIVAWQEGQTWSTRSLWGEVHPTSPVIYVMPDINEMRDPPELTAESRDLGMRSSMRVLIGTPADPLGFVSVGSKQSGRFSEFDARQLAQIVQPLAVAAQYFRSKKEAELRTQRLETTNRVLTRLGAGGTPAHLARGFLAECRALFGSRHALALQFDEDNHAGTLLALDTDFPAAETLPTRFVLEEMHTARMLRQPTPQLVVDVRQESTLNALHRHLIEAGVFSAIRAPLVVHDTVRGAVSLWAEGAGRFSWEDAELLGALTRPLALALEKASALESLGESELKYRSLVAQADEMIFLFDPDTFRILDANSFTSKALDYPPEELATLTLDRLLEASLDEIRRSVAVAISDGELHLTDARFRKRDGTSVDVDAVASMVTFGGRQAVLVLARDVSERKALVRQLMQSQKMDSLGAMAGAVAHDFNNLLTTILGFAGLLKRSQNLDTEERENLALIEDAARRAADLTGRLLSFSRGGLVRFGKVDLCTVAEDTLSLAEPTMHSKLTVTRSLPDAPVYVEGDGGQLQQALTNIVLNARDAMPEGGCIDISLRVDGSVAVVHISDTGPGMDEETRMRIFEPFYTTKAPGSGTGLGMAITYGIVQGHHGDITVHSRPGEGTEFTISLPLLDYGTAPAPIDLFSAGEGNLVLVVDDDAMVRRTTTATLAELGYNVVEAPGGSTAVEILKARPDRFCAVLLDLVMPGMTGSETFRALTAIRADLPVVVCTGYAADSHIDTDVKRR